MGQRRRTTVRRTSKRERRSVPIGQAHVQASFNNTLVTMTDLDGNVLTWGSSGASGFKGSRKSTPYAAQVAAQIAGKKAMDMGVREVDIFIKGPGPGREAAIRALQATGLKVRSIDHEVIIIDRAAQKEELRRKGVQRRRAQRQIHLGGKGQAHRRIGRQHRPRAHQHRKQAREMHCQRRAAIGKSLPRGMDIGILVALFERRAHIGMGIAPEQLRQVAGIQPRDQERGQHIVERRLTTLLLPAALLALPLHRKPIAIRQMFDEPEVLRLVRSFENRRDRSATTMPPAPTLILITPVTQPG